MIYAFSSCMSVLCGRARVDRSITPGRVNGHRARHRHQVQCQRAFLGRRVRHRAVACGYAVLLHSSLVLLQYEHEARVAGNCSPPYGDIVGDMVVELRPFLLCCGHPRVDWLSKPSSVPALLDGVVATTGAESQRSNSGPFVKPFRQVVSLLRAQAIGTAPFNIRWRARGGTKKAFGTGALHALCRFPLARHAAERGGMFVRCRHGIGRGPPAFVFDDVNCGCQHFKPIRDRAPSDVYLSRRCSEDAFNA